MNRGHDFSKHVNSAVQVDVLKSIYLFNNNKHSTNQYSTNGGLYSMKARTFNFYNFKIIPEATTKVEMLMNVKTKTAEQQRK